MKVVCQNCNKIYKISDERLPVGKKVVFRCRACDAPIRLDLRSLSKTSRDSIATPSNTRRKTPSARPDATRPYAKRQPSGAPLKFRLLKTIGDLPAVPEVVTKIQAIMADKLK